MRYLDKFKYNAEYGARGLKPIVFFNYDGTIAVFEGGKDDERVMDWVYANGEKLKEQDFTLNSETFAKIKTFLDEGKEVEVTSQTSEPLEETCCGSPENCPECTDWKAQALTLLNSKTLKVAELQEIVKKLLQ